jgi:hypothetical protein
MAAAVLKALDVVGVVGGLLGGGGESSVSESAKRLQDGDVQVIIDAEGHSVIFQIEESESQPIVFDVLNHILSGVTVIPRNGTAGAPSGSSGSTPAPVPYQSYYTRDEVDDILTTEHYTRTEIDELLTHYTQKTS